MGGGYKPADYGMYGGMYGMSAPAEKTYSTPTLKAMQMLESDPEKYMPFFVQKYGIKHLPRSLTMGPYGDQQSPATQKAK